MHAPKVIIHRLNLPCHHPSTIRRARASSILRAAAALAGCAAAFTTLISLT
jgi:hypothetical protein